MHVVMLPWLAFGHILPFTEFAKRVARQGHRVTLLSTPNNSRRLIDIPPALAGLIRVVDIPLPRVDRLPEHAEATIDLPSDDLRPYLRRAYDTAFEHELSRLLQEEGTSRPDWVLVDYAAYWAPAAAARHGVPCAFLSLFGAAALGFFGTPEDLVGLGEHARTEPAHFTVVPEYVPFPTTVAFRGYEARELFEPGMVPDDSGVSEGYRFAKSIEGCKLVGIRSSTEFEPEWVQLLGELYQKPVIPVGLFPPSPQQDVAGHEAAIHWLDSQAPNSVVYAAFGSEVKLTSAQLQRIALGLEASGLPFIWAFRPPTDAIAAHGDGTDGLPEGFEERLATASEVLGPCIGRGIPDARRMELRDRGHRAGRQAGAAAAGVRAGPQRQEPGGQEDRRRGGAGRAGRVVRAGRHRRGSEEGHGGRRRRGVRGQGEGARRSVWR